MLKVIGALLTSTVWPVASRTATTGCLPKAMVAVESEGLVVKASLVDGPAVPQELPADKARALNAAAARPSGAMARATAVKTATSATAADPVSMRILAGREARRELRRADRRAAIDARRGRAAGAASPGSGSGPDGLSGSSGGFCAGGRRDAVSSTPITSAPTLSSTHNPSGRNAPVDTQIEGRPIHRMSRQPRLMMLRRASGVLSGLRLASPAVTSVPSLFDATRRCSTKPCVAEPVGARNVITRPMGVGALAGSARDRTTSPRLI